MMAQVMEAVAAGLDRATVELAGMELMFERAADGKMTLRAPDRQARMRLFPGSAATPEDYPAELPFVPGEPVTIGNDDGASVLVWWAAADPEHVFHDLEARTIEEGWLPGDEIRYADIALTRKAFGKGDTERMIMLSTGIVTLMQRTSDWAGRRAARCGTKPGRRGSPGDAGRQA